MTRHLILVGAARSGTKLLRDCLAEVLGVGRVPYDIPFVWRQGRTWADDDRLDPNALTPRVQRSIARYIDGYAAGVPPTVLEKTVGNAVRVPFVQAVFPSAHFIHLIRDGMDVVESTRRQWTAPPDRRYLLRKLRHFPPAMLPTYGVQYIRSQSARRRSHERRVRTWGVRYPGIDDDLAQTDLLTVCARQWRWCVEAALDDFDALGIAPSTVRYEHLVADPVTTLREVAQHVGISADPRTLERMSTRFRKDRLGAGSRTLTAEEQALVMREIEKTRRRAGYPGWPTHREES